MINTYTSHFRYDLNFRRKSSQPLLVSRVHQHRFPHQQFRTVRLMDLTHICAWRTGALRRVLANSYLAASVVVAVQLVES